MSTPFVGEIRQFGFFRVPIGWLSCNGDLYAISQYEVLFSLIGTTYGGDGQTTFAVPNLCGRVPIHQGTGQGLSTYVLGQMAGSEAVTLLPIQLPMHTHPMVATTVAATAVAVGQTVEFGAVSGDSPFATDVTGATGFNTSPLSTQFVGSTQPHENTMPTLTVQFCIAAEGIYPTQG